MTDERDDLLREIGGALSIEPSPAFAARVRERIADEPASIWQRRGVWWAVTGTGLATAAAITLVMLSPTREPAAAVQPAVVAQVPESAVSPSNPAAGERTPEASGAGLTRAEPPVARRGVVKPTALEAAPEEPRGVTGPDMIVVTNQGAVLQGLWAQLPASVAAVTTPGPAPVVATAPAPPDPVAAPIVVPEIKVDPIVFLLNSPPPGSPGGGSIRKVIAEESAGSRES